jgi:hypothetical protein
VLWLWLCLRSEEIERYVTELIDWFLDKQAKFWNQSVEFLIQRVQNVKSDKLFGQVRTQFHFDRSSLLRNIGDRAKRVVNTLDKEKMTKEICAKIASSLYQTAALELGAILGLVCYA